MSDLNKFNLDCVGTQLNAFLDVVAYFGKKTNDPYGPR